MNKILTLLVLTFFAVKANGIVTFGNGYSGTSSEINSNSELAYASDVSDSDLIAGMTVPDGAWNVGNNAHPDELTDGIHGATFSVAPDDRVQGGWTTVGANAVYDLGAGANGLGHDLSSISSIAAWSGGGLGQQAWAIEVRPLGGAFQTLATIDYQPFSDGNTATSADRIGGATKVTMTDLNVTGIDAIRITANEVDSNNNFVWRELDIFGAETTGPAPLRIMPMGDSITVGYTNADWSGGGFESGYRSGLYTRLADAGYNFTFVGSSTEPWSFRDPATTDPAYPPTLDLPGLGQDGHNGYGGKTASFLNSNILTWLANDDPDIILLKIGTNSQDLAGLTTLVNTITTTKPNLKLIIAEIMPKWSYQQGIVDYNTGVHALAGGNVTVVDQYAPFLTTPSDLTSIDRSLISNGINHPDIIGYDKMAQIWFDEIQSLGLGPNTFSKWIGGFDGVSGQTDLIDDPDGDDIPNGIENFFGTAPDGFSLGLMAGTINSALGTFTLTHPQGVLADDLSASYQWSKDSQNFQGHLATDVGGTTVEFTTQADTPEPGITTVTASVTGTACDWLFLRVVVTEN